MSKIRVGLIRCDTHGMWYGPLMAEHDPLLLQRPMDPRLPAPYTWQKGGNHRYFYGHYADPTRMTVPFTEGFEIVKLWDEHRGAAEMASRVFLGKPKVCGTFEEVSDDVDLVFIADCNYDGSDHLELATPGLKKGVPTFVDKPFSNTVVDARNILELGKKHNAPLFSHSILRADTAIAKLRKRLDELDGVNLITASGFGTNRAGLVHTVSIIQHLCGPGIQSVRALTAPNQTAFYLDYGDQAGQGHRPAHGAVIHCDAGQRIGSGVAVNVFGVTNDICLRHPGDDVFPFGTAEIIRMIRQRVQPRTTPAELMEEAVESIAVMQACDDAKTTGKPVAVQNVG
jgi:predicted dehydrogenase